VKVQNLPYPFLRGQPLKFDMASWSVRLRSDFDSHVELLMYNYFYPEFCRFPIFDLLKQNGRKSGKICFLLIGEYEIYHCRVGKQAVRCRTARHVF